MRRHVHDEFTVSIGKKLVGKVCTRTLFALELVKNRHRATYRLWCDRVVFLYMYRNDAIGSKERMNPPPVIIVAIGSYGTRV